jgi:hypothetical protein
MVRGQTPRRNPSRTFVRSLRGHPDRVERLRVKLDPNETGSGVLISDSGSIPVVSEDNIETISWPPRRRAPRSR